MVINAWLSQVVYTNPPANGLAPQLASRIGTYRAGFLLNYAGVKLATTLGRA